MANIVNVRQEGAVAEVILNRPERKNALSWEMFEAIVAAAHEVRAQDGVRAVILRGEGGDFCSGLDMDAMAGQAGEIDALRERLMTPLGEGQANWFQMPATVWAGLDVPVIAAVEGVCLGGGLQIVLGADFRICHPEARLSIMEAKWGLVPDMGISQSLPKLMAADRAKDLMMTARVISGAQAEAFGLVSEISADPLGRAGDLARAISERSPDAIAGIKRLVDGTWAMPEGEGLRLEAEIQSKIIGGPNQIEAVMSNLQKRPAQFR